MRLIAKNSIRFRSNKQQINYEDGERIAPKHEYIVKTYFSGQVLEERAFKTKSINRNTKIDKRKIKNSYNEMKELIIDTKNSVNEIRELVGVLSKIRDVKKDKESHIELLVEVLNPQKDDVDIEGDIHENKSESTDDIKEKVKKIKKIARKKKNG